MAGKDPRIDAYIDKSQEFAKPILSHIRKLVHQACPDVDETMKWSFPHFEYNGAILCSMASFKQHCSFGFWLASLMKDPQNIIDKGNDRTGMGHFGKLQSMKDLPTDKVMIEYIKEAKQLIQKGAKLPKREKTNTGEVEVPEYFTKALKKNKAAFAYFDKSSNSHKREYIQWITEAKTEETRNKRMATAIEWLEEGKGRNWKYEKVK